MNFNWEISVGDIISVFALIGSIIMFISSNSSRKEAKKSEEQAAKFEKNADEHNKSAKEYYKLMNEELKRHRFAYNKDEICEKIYQYIHSDNNTSTESVAKAINMSNEDTEDLLYYMWQVKKTIKQHVPVKKGEYNRMTWIVVR